jgi:hypothetical protein
MLRKGERLVEGDSGKEAIDLAPFFLVARGRARGEICEKGRAQRGPYRAHLASSEIAEARDEFALVQRVGRLLDAAHSGHVLVHFEEAAFGATRKARRRKSSSRVVRTCKNDYRGPDFTRTDFQRCALSRGTDIFSFLVHNLCTHAASPCFDHRVSASSCTKTR